MNPKDKNFFLKETDKSSNFYKKLLFQFYLFSEIHYNDVTYCILKVGKKPSQKTCIKVNTISPKWNENFVL